MLAFRDLDVMTLVQGAWGEGGNEVTATVVVENFSLVEAEIDVVEMPNWIKLGGGGAPGRILPRNSVNITAVLNVEEIIPGSEKGSGVLRIAVKNGNDIVIPVFYEERVAVRRRLSTLGLVGDFLKR